MHDNHEPTCLVCADFVFPFDKDSPLAEWGYCERELHGREPTQEELKEIEEQVGKGDYSFLSKENIPLYQAMGEGCEHCEDL
tara:strand:+ start:129 stop:374 length:246 start_codon:yes stop_codon:yes gene_type:complete